jgi:hypothetical protein
MGVRAPFPLRLSGLQGAAAGGWVLFVAAPTLFAPGHSREGGSLTALARSVSCAYENARPRPGDPHDVRPARPQTARIQRVVRRSKNKTATLGSSRRVSSVFRGRLPLMRQRCVWSSPQPCLSSRGPRGFADHDPQRTLPRNIEITWDGSVARRSTSSENFREPATPGGKLDDRLRHDPARGKPNPAGLQITPEAQLTNPAGRASALAAPRRPISDRSPNQLQRQNRPADFQPAGTQRNH